MGTLVASSVNTQYTSSGTSCQVALPAGIQSGDIILIFLGHGNAATYSSTSAGYTNDVTISNGTACTAARFTKTAAGTEGGTTFSTTLSSSSTRFLVAEVWRGVTLDSVNGTNTGSSSSPGTAGVTATAQPGVAVGFSAGRGATDGTTVAVSSAPSTYTLDTQQTSGLGSTNRNTGGGAWYKSITSTTVAAASATFSQSTSWATITTVLTDSTSPVSAAIADTHATSGTISATSPISAAITDTHSVTGAISATDPPNTDVAITDTHTTSGTLSATSPISAAITDTQTTAGAVRRIDSASGAITDTQATTGTLSAINPFPFGPTRIRVSLDLDGSGAFATDITDYVKLSEGVEIVRGLQSEGSTAGPATGKLTLINSDFRFNPDNALSPYFPHLVRNTPIQISVPHIVTRLVVPTGVPSALSTPDTAALSITGDIDVRVWLQADDWQAGGSANGCTVFNKWLEAGDQRSWAVDIDADGFATWLWSTAGTAASSHAVTSTFVIPPGPRDQVLRIGHDVDNGAGGNDVTFWTGPSLSGPWTQLGAVVTTGGTTSIYNSTAPVAIGDHAAWGGRWAFECYGATILSGIDGTPVSTLNLRTLVEGQTTVTDAEGNVWTPAAGAELQTLDRRYVGAVPDWPMEHGLTAEDCEVSITGYDVIRRLQRSAAPAASAYRRACTAPVPSVASLVGFWPMEDDRDATAFGAGLTGQADMPFEGTPALASNSTAFACCDALPVFAADTKATVKITDYTSTNQIQVRLLVSVPAAGVAADTLLFQLWTTGSASKWDVSISTTGALSLAAFASGASVLSSGPTAMGLNGVPARVTLSLARNGTGIDWSYSVLPVGGSVTAASGTLASHTVGKAAQVRIAGYGGLADCVVGALTVQSAVTSTSDLSGLLRAHAGETAQVRIARLCAESGLAARVQGVEGLAMGVQRPGTLLELLRDAETSDDGILYSTRDVVGIAYRSTDSMSARDPVLTAGYLTSGMSDFRPVKGDQGITNDVTMSRTGGSKYRATQLIGPLSIQDPPNGMGLYDGGGGESVSLQTDNLLPHRVTWELNQGTSDAPRLTAVTFDLSGGPHQAGGADHLTLSANLRRLDVGDRLLVTDVPGFTAPTVDQVLIGYREYISPHEHTISAVGIPYEPYRVLVFDQDCRYSADGAYLTTSTDTSQTAITVTNPADTEWTHDDGDFSVTVGGEEMTVTGVASGNLLPNPTADAGITDWRAINGTVSHETSITHGGAGSVKLVTGAGPYPKIESGGSGLTPVNPGEILTLSAWLRADTARYVQLVAEWYDESEVYAGYAQIVQAQLMTPDTWTLFTGSCTVPDDGVVTFATLAGQNDGGGGGPGAGLVLYLDDASISANRQELTVVRGVNGITRAHAAGELIDVTSPYRWGL